MRARRKRGSTAGRQARRSFVEASRATGRGTLIFDGECGFCTRSAGWLRRLDRRGRLTLRPYQDASVLAAAGLTVEQASESVWWRDADGSALRGAHAVNAALSTALGVRVPLWLYRLSRPLQERVYAWVAANRHRLPGVTPYCTEHPAECERSRNPLA